MTNGISKLVAIIYLYLANLICGREFVKKVDKLVSDDQFLNLPAECQKSFDDLHEKLALCVWDERTYEENPGIYISETEMKESVETFIRSWGKLLAEQI